MTEKPARYFVRFHGDHGFVSNGAHYPSLADAETAAREALASGYWRGASIICNRETVKTVSRDFG